TYNFDQLAKLYLINYKKGPNPINIIGGTSPSTLFFTSANKYDLEGFQEGNDRMLDEDYKPLHERDPEFIKYLFSLKHTIPGFSNKMRELSDYFEMVFRNLPQDLKDMVVHNADHYNTLPNHNIDGGGEIIEILGVNLKKAKDKKESIKESDFLIHPDKTIEELY